MPVVPALARVSSRCPGERSEVGDRQLPVVWALVSKGNVGKTSERQGGAHMGFSERIDTVLN